METYKNMITDMFKKELAYDLSKYIVMIGVLLLVIGIINIIASYVGMECYNRNNDTMSEYSVGKNYLIFNMVLISLITLLGLVLIIHGAVGTTVLVLQG